jgi:hypothetical protein
MPTRCGIEHEDSMTHVPTRRVLVVEDDENLRVAVTAELGGNGLAVDTAGDLADAAEAVAAPPTVAAVRALAAQVDHAVWAAPRDPDGGDTARAWATVDTIRRGLARRGWRARLRAALDHRTLRAP